MNWSCICVNGDGTERNALDGGLNRGRFAMRIEFVADLCALILKCSSKRSTMIYRESDP